MIIPLLIFATDIQCISVSYDRVIYKGTNYPTQNSLPANITVTFYNNDTGKLEVGEGCKSKGNDPNNSEDSKTNGFFKYTLNSVSATPGSATLRAYFQVWDSASVSLSTHHSLAKAEGRAETTWQKRKKSLKISGANGESEGIDPTTPTATKWVGKYNINWTDSLAGYRFTSIFFNTFEMVNHVKTSFTGSGGNSTVAQASSGTFCKATLLKVIDNSDASLSGLVFNALSSLSDRPVTIRLANQYNAPLDEFLNMSESGGTDVAFEGLTTGTYLVKISAAGMLTKQISVTLQPGTTNSFGTVTTWLGDINGDNTIDSTDTALINKYLNVSSGSTRWTIGDMDDDYTGADCDLNNDNVVDSTDLAIATANLNKTGD